MHSLIKYITTGYLVYIMSKCTYVHVDVIDFRKKFSRGDTPYLIQCPKHHFAACSSTFFFTHALDLQKVGNSACVLFD